MTPKTVATPAPGRGVPPGPDELSDTHWRRWPEIKFGVLGFGVLVLTVMWTAGIAYFQYAAQRQIEYTNRTNDNLSAAFAAHTAQALREIEGVLRVISMEQRRFRRRFDLHAFAQEARFDPDFIVALIITDADGKVVQTSLPRSGVRSYADREHFRAQVGSNSDQLYSGRPVLGRYSKADVIPFSLRISGPRGEFLGVAIAGVNPRHFVNLYRKVVLGDKGAVTLFGLDGFIRARVTAVDVGVGQDVRQAPVTKAAQEQAAGRILTASVTDKLRRYYTYQRVPGYPLSVAVGQAEDEALAEVNRTEQVALAGGVIITFLLIAATLLLVLGVAREQRMLSALQKGTSELQSANKELETFTYSVAHDLRAPLRGIDGYSQLLLTNYADKLDDEGRQFLGKVRQAAQQMGRLIEDLLAYARLERRDLQIGPVDLQELLGSLLAERADDIRTRGVEVKLAVSCQSVTADRDGLAMALRNLLENALKFSSRTARPTIEIAARDTPTTCILSVRDNGVGFDMKYQERIFDIFQRLHRSEDYPGTGVGLAIVKKAMQRMGGRAWAESEPGKGATFYLEIPK
jgi:signal transduction histidine kinase